MILGNKTKNAFKQIKDSIQERIAELRPDECKSYTRFRYADNINQWIELAAVTIGGESALRVVFIYLSDFRTAKKEIRQNSVTASFTVEVIYQFAEGTDAANSTQDFEDLLGDINDLFLDEEALGFTDASSNPVLNTPITGEPGDPKPQYIDGVLGHRKLLNLEVTFRICKGGDS